MPLPDIRGRREILKVHMRKVPIAGDVGADIIVRGTPSFSGPISPTLVNESRAVRGAWQQAPGRHGGFRRPGDKIMMGAERRSMVMSEEEKQHGLP